MFGVGSRHAAVDITFNSPIEDRRLFLKDNVLVGERLLWRYHLQGRVAACRLTTHNFFDPQVTVTPVATVVIRQLNLSDELRVGLN